MENDLKDLIIYLYNAIHYEINKINNYNINNNIDLPGELALFRSQYYSNNSSFIIDTFFFEQQSTIRCLNCNFSHISYNINNIIIFYLEKVRKYISDKSPCGFFSISLENCFENYEDEELLYGQNQIYCSNCMLQSDAYRSNKILTGPEVMTISLVREGLDVNFEYPLVLNLGKYIKTKCKEDFRYELIGIISLLKEYGKTGHFIATCKSPVDCQWYCYNDTVISKCDDPLKEDYEDKYLVPYVLFYQKCKMN